MVQERGLSLPADWLMQAYVRGSMRVGSKTDQWFKESVARAGNSDNWLGRTYLYLAATPEGYAKVKILAGILQVVLLLWELKVQQDEFALTALMMTLWQGENPGDEWTVPPNIGIKTWVKALFSNDRDSCIEVAGHFDPGIPAGVDDQALPVLAAPLIPSVVEVLADVGEVFGSLGGNS